MPLPHKRVTAPGWPFCLASVPWRTLPLLVGLSGVAGGCTSDKVVGRYETAQCVDVDNVIQPCHDVWPAADVAVATIATPGGAAAALNVGVPAPPAAASAGSSSPSNGLNMPERALAAYIAALADAKVAKSADALRKNIAAAIKAEVPAATEDHTIFHRTMIVTIARDPLSFNPADRLEAIDVAIRPDNAVIQSWDTAATLYSTINAGTVQLTGTESGAASGTVGTPAAAPIAAGLTGGYAQSQSRVETFTATRQAESLTVSLVNNDPYALDPEHPNELRIHRQGGIGVDLTGNVVVKVDIVLPEDSSHGNPPIYLSRRWLYSVKGDYFDKQGQPAKSADLKLTPQLAVVAKHVDPRQPPTPITATAVLIYTLRHVTAGDDTLEEKDDTVTEKTIRTAPRKIVLVPGGQASPPAYSITGADGAWLKVEQPGSAGSQFLCLASYDGANDLAAYLKQSGARSPATLGTARLGFSTLDPARLRPLRAADLAGLAASGSCPD